MLSCLVRQHPYELFHALFYSPLSIAPVYHTMSILSITFLVYQSFELERVMAVSKGVTTRSSEKIVLLVDADRTTVVLAQGPDPPHNPDSRRLYPYPVGQRTSYTPSNPNPDR